MLVFQVTIILKKCSIVSSVNIETNQDNIVSGLSIDVNVILVS